MLGALQRLIRPGDVVYDVGANIGLYTRFIAHFGASQIIAFEPMTENRKLLALNVVGLPVQIVPFALADQDGEEDFQVDDMMSGSAALDRVTGGLASAGRRQYGLPPLTERVGVTRLDGLPQLPPPNVIKIDIEGAEAMMLRGAIESLQRYRPRLVIEMHQVPITIEVIDILIDAGYVTYGILGTYRRISREDRYLLTDPYSLHHIIASADETDLRDPITVYS
jgi:FkbM family methyltransferase